MKLSALFIGSLAGTLAAVAAFVVYDWFAPILYFLQYPRMIVFPLLIAGSQAFFLALPGLFALNHFDRLNWLSAVVCGAISAALPWLSLTWASREFTFVAWLALFGAVGGLVGYFVARAVSPNNSFKPTPLRGAS
jgi:hypothetical protein